MQLCLVGWANPAAFQVNFQFNVYRSLLGHQVHSEQNLWFQDECSASLQPLLKVILQAQLSRFAT